MIKAAAIYLLTHGHRLQCDSREVVLAWPGERVLCFADDRTVLHGGHYARMRVCDDGCAAPQGEETKR